MYGLIILSYSDQPTIKPIIPWENPGAGNSLKTIKLESIEFLENFGDLCNFSSFFHAFRPPCSILLEVTHPIVVTIVLDCYF